MTRIEEKQIKIQKNQIPIGQKSAVEEYNQLSTQIKQLITDTNEVLPVNQTLYQETYTQLQQKVTEIKQHKPTQMKQRIQQKKFCLKRKKRINH